MKRIALGMFALALVGFALPAIAAENANGTWKLSTSVGGQTREATLKLKQEGDKLTGTYAGGQSNTESAIEDGTIKDNTISFKVTREFNGQKRTTKYTGTIKEDTITGKSERERDGQVQSSEFTAKRQK